MMTQDWHLAQINVGRLRAPQGDPTMQDFFDALDRINAIAETSPGFVWRLQTPGDADAPGYMTLGGPLLIVNMSVWTDADVLFDFTYRSAHTPVMARRRDWFDRFEGAYQALWWIPAGTVPTVNDGLSRLWHLDRFGPTPDAFTFKARFPEPGLATPPVDMQPDPWCMGTA